MARIRSTTSVGGRPPKGRRRRRQTKLRPASAVETALAALAHEVRTPLTGILALGELLAASDLPDRERRWADAVKSAAQHLAQLTTLVVDGAKAGKRTLRLSGQRFRPRALAEAVAATMRARADAKGLATEIDLAANLPDLVVGDPVRLRAAVENLIDNAVKFTQHGRIGLSVRAEPAGRNRIRLDFRITDTGVGLSKLEIKRLFRPFAQANTEVAGRFGGAGLGLVFVRRVAKAMGGDVTIESESRRGSSFRLAVLVDPAAADDDATGREGLPSHADAPAASLRILCAEDNPYGRVILNTILTELGHRVDFAASGEAAHEAVARGGYDLVLMDVSLPGIDGIEATRRIRRLEGTVARIPIIGISGRDAPGDEAAARAAGMDFYLVKPVSPSVLSRMLAAKPAR